MNCIIGALIVNHIFIILINRNPIKNQLPSSSKTSQPMKLSRLFTVRASNLKYYPSFLVRILLCIFPVFLVLDFDYIASKKSITEGNYWAAKGIVYVATVFTVEYIYFIHVWCTLRFSSNGPRYKFAVLQCLLGIVLPLFITLQLLKIAGVTYIPNVPLSMGVTGSMAMVHETLILFNVLFFLCYLNAPLLALERYRKNNKDLWILNLGNPEKVKISSVLLISQHDGVNFLMTDLGMIKFLVSSAPLDEFAKTLPSDEFEHRGDGLYRKEINEEKEMVLRRTIDFYLRKSPDV